MNTHKYTHGLTLVEMLVVVAVIAVLATMVIKIAGRIDTKSKERSLASTYALLEFALQEYCESADKFPEQPERNFANAPLHSEYLCKELQLMPESRQVFEKVTNSLVKNKYGTADTPPEIYDPWGTALDYVYGPGDNFPELISAGPDRLFGTTDDITNRQ